VTELGPDEYESLTGIPKAEYEARVLAAARARAADLYPVGSPDATIETVSIDGDGLDACLVVVFRIAARPECRWGLRFEMWPFDPEFDETPEYDGADCIEAGVSEYVDQGGLVVHECGPDEITWLP
jgi:hypothetical protein